MATQPSSIGHYKNTNTNTVNMKTTKNIKKTSLNPKSISKYKSK